MEKLKSHHLIHKVPKKTPDWALLAKLAQAQSGTGFTTLGFHALVEAWFNKTTPEDFFKFALYRKHLSIEDRRAFKSTNSVRNMIAETIQSRHLNIPNAIHFKSHFATFAKQNNLTPPRTLAYYGLKSGDPRMIELSSADEMVQFLLQPSFHPIFGKPNRSMLALGSFGTKKVDPISRCITFTNDKVVPVKELAQEIISTYPTGYIFQAHIGSHPVMVDYFGSLPPVFRFNTLKPRDGPAKLYQANARLVFGKVMSPNSHLGRRDYAPIDLDTGRFKTAFTGGRCDFQQIHRLPFTGKDCTDVEIPFFSEAKDQVENAHNILGPYPVLGWDVIVTPTGPVTLEVNVNPDLDYFQVILDTGLGSSNFSFAFE